MRSIFFSSVSANLSRINTERGTKQIAGGSSEKPAGDFSEILQRIEAGNTKTFEGNQKLTKSSQAPVPTNEHPLSNLTSTETESLHWVEKSLPHSATPPEGLPSILSPSVNSDKVSVKTPPPRPGLSFESRLVPGTDYKPQPIIGPISGGIPKPPVIRGIEKVGNIPAPKLSEGEITNIISAAGKYHGVNPSLGIAVARAESSLRPDAVSNDGHRSKGIFQLLDTTGKELLGRFSLEQEHYEPFDPALNSFLGMGYLKRLHQLFSHETVLAKNLKTVPVKSAENLEKLAVAAFNAGEGSVARAQHKAKALGLDPTRYDAVQRFLPASTREYVTRVSNLKRQSEIEDRGSELA